MAEQNAVRTCTIVCPHQVQRPFCRIPSWALLGSFPSNQCNPFKTLRVPNGTYDNARQISRRSEDMKRDFLPVEHFPGLNKMCHFCQAGILLVSKRAKYICRLGHNETVSSASRMLTTPFPWFLTEVQRLVENPMPATAELDDTTPRSAFYTFQEVLINRRHRTSTHSCFPLTNSLMTVLWSFLHRRDFMFFSVHTQVVYGMGR